VAHSLSARKRVRQNAKSRIVNRARRSTIKTDVRDCLTLLHGTDLKAAQARVDEAVRRLDREASKGLLHKNAAARRKSRLARKLNAMKAKSGK
jgi:small subunit ribosomal protein S20